MKHLANCTAIESNALPEAFQPPNRNGISWKTSAQYCQVDPIEYVHVCPAWWIPETAWPSEVSTGSSWANNGMTLERYEEIVSEAE